MKTQVSIEGLIGFIEFDDEDCGDDAVVIDSMKANGDAQTIIIPIKHMGEFLKFLNNYMQAWQPT
jgi:hypothetical protein